MKKLLLGLMLLALPAFGQRATCFDTTMSTTGSTLLTPSGGASQYAAANFTYRTTGSPTGVSISIDAGNVLAATQTPFEQIAAVTNTAGADMGKANGPFRNWYANLGTLSGGTSPTVILTACFYGSALFSLTGPDGVITGEGTTNTVTKFTGANAVGDSQITDTGSAITLPGTVNLSAGNVTSVPYFGTGGLVSSNTNFVWDNTNETLVIGKATLAEITSNLPKLATRRTSTLTTGASYGNHLGVSANPASSSSGTYGAIFAQTRVEAANAQNLTNATSGLDGVLVQVAHLGTGTVTAASGFVPSLFFNSTGTVTTWRGVNIVNPTVGAGGTVTTNIGLNIENQTAGGTDFAIVTGTGLVSFGDRVTAPLYSTTTNCADAAGAAACGAAPAGAVVIDAAATTVTVSTTAVTANSRIFIQEAPYLATELAITCNTTTGRDYTVTALTAATSFVITTSAAPVTTPACLNYIIFN